MGVDARSCTVLIANLDAAEFAENVGDSIVSRIHEIGEAVLCDWPSYRKPGGWRQSEGAALRNAQEDPPKWTKKPYFPG
jgi:hypothetical protein